MFDLIAFDADDTLWHNETIYVATQARLRQMLAAYASADEVDRVLHETEMHNLELFGYGIKGFTLSMIETALAVSEGRVSAREIGQIVDLARDMLRTEVRLLDHVEETLARLAQDYPLMIVTKGDLRDQERRIAQSGMAHWFTHVQIVSEKSQEVYAALLARYGVPPARFLMVGNSLRSDVLPVVALGGHAVYIPYPLTWAHETIAPEMAGDHRYHTLEHIGLLPALIEKLAAEG